MNTIVRFSGITFSHTANLLLESIVIHMYAFLNGHVWFLETKAQVIRLNTIKVGFIQGWVLFILLFCACYLIFDFQGPCKYVTGK